MPFESNRIREAEQEVINMQQAHAAACVKYNDTEMAIYAALADKFAKMVCIAQEKLLIERAREW